MDDTVAVTTADSLEDILAANNSAAWSLDVGKHGANLKYLICARKTASGKRQAFLLCLIRNFSVDPGATSRSSRTKYAIEFHQYLGIDKEVDDWRAGQNPVRVGSLSHFLKGFVPPAPEEFETAPKKTRPYSYSQAPTDRGLTIAQAKAGLALHFGIPESAVRISLDF